MAGLSKSKLLSYRQCPKRLWLETYRPEGAVCDEGTAARIEAGLEVGEAARTLQPRAGALAAALREDGYIDLREIPPGRLDNALHERIRAATVSGVPYLDPEARRFLSLLGHPRHYLDFETIQFAVPIWAGTRPYQGGEERGQFSYCNISE